jgi:hypothetical protein
MVDVHFVKEKQIVWVFIAFARQEMPRKIKIQMRDCITFGLLGYGKIFILHAMNVTNY